MEEIKTADGASLTAADAEGEVRLGVHALRSALVIDPDETFLACLQREPEFSKHRPVTAHTFEQIHRAIGDPSARYCGIFVSCSVARPTLVPLIALIRARYPATPLFLTYEQEIPFSLIEATRLTVSDMLPRANLPQVLSDRVLRSGWPLVFSKAAAYSKETETPEANADHVMESGVGPAETSRFARVPLLDFVSGEVSPFDAYIQLKPGHYVKVANAKEAVDPRRILRYAALGVQYLYLVESARRRHQDYCQVLAKNLLHRPGISLGTKLLHTAALSERLADQVSVGTVTPQAFDLAEEYLGTLHTLIQMAESSPAELMRTYLKVGPLLDHGAQVSILAAFMAVPLEIKNHRVFEQLGMACLFHDIGLLKLPENLRTDDAAIGTAEDRRFHERHPKLGAEILEDIGLLSPRPTDTAHRSIRFHTATIQAVAQHHERRDKSGYPHRLGASQIHPFAEIIGIAEEFVHERRRVGPVAARLLEALEEPRFQAFSAKTLSALKAAIAWAVG